MVQPDHFLWWELFSWCWTSGMVPSVWRSMVVPVPKKRNKGVCKKEDFRGSKKEEMDAGYIH